jgi:hypothetical protein
MTDARETAGSTTVFRPRPSRGALVLVVLAFVVLALTAGPVLTALDGGGLDGEQVVTLLIGVALAAPLLALAAMVPSMRYELSPGRLTLRCGVLRYEIPVERIRGVRTTDLDPQLWSSLRLPGLALFTVPYSDVGRVKMCATRAAEDILLVETDDGLYGITPAEEDRFVDRLTTQLPSR